ncbi:Wadjet anti-phage system protein JetD domain-containing protein [Nocardiopsis synnemataformans]|uniref:Wadjet anti-phage system protein JetD domain-containing protein n=1 Tax=Nocardiopsis synnemataformans TaxID=61305 RepID=UPI003EB6B499
MKTPEQVVADIERRLAKHWHTAIAGGDPLFPHLFPLGRLTRADLEADYAAVHTRTVQWQDWTKARDLALDYENRSVKGTSQVVPTHLGVDSLDRAAAIVGGAWPARLERARRRHRVLQERYPQMADPARVLRLVDQYTPLDFDLLTTVADWYLADPARAGLGVTPRQVPLPGVHAKWLQAHTKGVLALTGLDDLGLRPAHPSRIHFTYLDPAYRATGVRVHDSATVGDTFTPAYQPDVVLISENKDTAIHFPPAPGGMAVEGHGFGGRTAAAFAWLAGAPRLFYWGDIDRHGYEILNGFRADGLPVTSILMDPHTYDAYERYGTDTDKNGAAIKHGTPKPLAHLTGPERAVYLRLLDADHTGHRRIEQERIPLTAALEALGL